MLSAFKEQNLADAGFARKPSPAGFGSLWHSYRAQNERCWGWCHYLFPDDEPWGIIIHDLTVRDDFILNLESPGYLTVTWFKSISGEEFNPYRRLKSNSVLGQGVGGGLWRGVAHGGVPVQSVSIEISPEFSSQFLEREYGGEFRNVEKAFYSLGRDDEFPEMKTLLSQLWPQPGDESRTKLYYHGKVLEAMGLIVERSRATAPDEAKGVSPVDRNSIHEVVCYIDDHCSAELRISELAAIACMSPTKFKETFKRVNGMTVTRYVQARRVSQAELLLRQSDLSIGQVARAVGYSCPSHFSALFKREVGMLPSEFRKAAGAH